MSCPPPSSLPPLGTDLRTKLDQAYKVLQAHSAKGLIPYLNQIRIDCRPEPRYFREVADPWQWGLMQELAPAVEYCAGLRKEYSGPRNFFYVMHKGSDKTGALSRVASFMLAFHRRNSLDCYAASGDRDQAALLLEAMRKEAQLNPWMEKLLYFKNYEVKGVKGARLTALSADAKTSHGPAPDLIIMDEVTWWEGENSQKLFASLNGARAKKPNCVVLIISNAGIEKTWQHDHLLLAKRSSEWRVYEAPVGNHLASWMDEKTIENLMRELPPMMAARMYRNAWLDPAESCGFVTRYEVEACAQLGEALMLAPRYAGTPGKLYMASIDYGPTKDRTVCLVLHQEGDLVVVDRMDVWQGSKKNRVPIERVEQWINEVRHNFDLAALVVDPAGLESTCQKFEKLIPFERFEARGGKGNYQIFQALRSAIINKRVTWYPGCGDIIRDGINHTIVDEISELVTKKMGYGMRLDHLPGRHDDRAVALGMALAKLLERPLKKDVLVNDYWW